MIETVTAIFSTMRHRRSVRRFTSEPVSEETVVSILESARWAPSPHNSQPWRFVVVRPGTGREHLAKAMTDRWLADLTAHTEQTPAIMAKVATRRRRLVEAPAAVVLCLTGSDLDQYPDEERRTAEWLTAEQSLGAATQNLLLAAHGVGLGACWICAPSFCSEVVADALKLPDGLAPRVLVLIGHPAGEPPTKDRRNLEDMVLFR